MVFRLILGISEEPSPVPVALFRDGKQWGPDRPTSFDAAMDAADCGALWDGDERHVVLHPAYDICPTKGQTK